MVVLADFDLLVHRLIRALLIFVVSYFAVLSTFPPHFSPGEIKIKLMEVILQKQDGPGLFRR